VTSEGTHAGIKHELADMVDLVPDGNPMKPGLRAIEHLSRYATSFRYPVTSSASKRILPAPNAAELAAAIAATAHALTDAVSRFGVDLKRADSPATTAAPIR
jgi:hypothetical protein